MLPEQAKAAPGLRAKFLFEEGGGEPVHLLQLEAEVLKISEDHVATSAWEAALAGRASRAADRHQVDEEVGVRDVPAAGRQVP